MANITGIRDELIIDYGRNPPVITIHDGVKAGGHDIKGNVVTGIGAPVVASPANTAVSINQSPIIRSGAFNGIATDLTSETMAAMFIEIATDLAFTTIVHASGRQAGNTGVYDLGVAGIQLAPSVEHFVRIKHEAVSGGLSNWGPVSSFIVDALAINGVISTLPPSLASTSGGYGSAVVISDSGDVAVIGAPTDSNTSASGGAVFILKLVSNIWVEVARLTSPSAAPSAYFGSSIDVNADGSVIVVGASNDVNAAGVAGAGKAYVITDAGTGYAVTQELIPTDHTDIGWFGYSVAIAGVTNEIIIGSPTKSNGLLTTVGTVYVFTADVTGAYVQSANIVPAVLSQGGYFGYSVAIADQGVTAVITAPTDATLGIDSGTGFVYTSTSGAWSPSGTLTATGVSAYDKFGISSAISAAGDRVVIGAEGDDSAVSGGGAAYVFNVVTGVPTLAATLTAPTPALNDQFGHAVGMSGDGLAIIVGCPMSDSSANDAGLVYTFADVSGTWLAGVELGVTGSLAADYLGTAVSLSGDGARGIVGAPGSDTGLTDAGNAFLLG